MQVELKHVLGSGDKCAGTKITAYGNNLTGIRIICYFVS